MKSLTKFLTIIFICSSFINAQTNDELKLYGLIKSGVLVSEGTYFYTGKGLIGFKNNSLGLGAGTGYENYPNGSVIPLFGDLRIFLSNDNKINPLFFGELGYSVAKVNNVDGWDKGGLMLQVGAGVNVNLSSGMIVLVELAYQRQNSKAQRTKMYYSSTRGFYNEYSLEDSNYNFLSINVGLTIN